MKSLIYLVVTAGVTELVALVVRAILGKRVERAVKKVEAWIKKRSRLLTSVVRSLHQGPFASFLWLLGLFTVLYVLTFVVLVFVGGTPTVDVPEQDIYVPDGQQGEARILVEDKSFRGLVLRNFFPPASLMKVKATARQGRLTVLDGESPEVREEMVLSVRQDEVVVLRYSFAEGHQMGDIEVSVFGLFDDVQKDVPAEIKTIHFRRTTE